jgi:BirA family transcriptional regulator, biotin operon repressor / biotin---[acetyl-CoA-carboxylase] ligase
LDALDAGIIRTHLAARGEIASVEVLGRCVSTNSDLMSRMRAPVPVLLLAEEQTAGRGRRGRRWISGPGTGLMFSLRWECGRPAARLSGLSLAVGACLAGTLRALGAKGIALKWPNDLVVACGADAAKLGGVLIETCPSPGGLAAVIGIGINYRREAGLGGRLKRAIASLDETMRPLPDRNDLAVALVADLLPALRRFAESGFAAFKDDWEALHACQGEPMRIRTSQGRIVVGIADGVAPDGGLLLRNRRGVQRIYSGSVVRKVSGATGPVASAS